MVNSLVFPLEWIFNEGTFEFELTVSIEKENYVLNGFESRVENERRRRPKESKLNALNILHFPIPTERGVRPCRRRTAVAGDVMSTVEISI